MAATDCNEKLNHKILRYISDVVKILMRAEITFNQTMKLVLRLDLEKFEKSSFKSHFTIFDRTF